MIIQSALGVVYQSLNSFVNHLNSPCVLHRRNPAATDWVAGLALALANQRLLFLLWKPGFHVGVCLIRDRAFARRVASSLCLFAVYSIV